MNNAVIVYYIIKTMNVLLSSVKNVYSFHTISINAYKIKNNFKNKIIKFIINKILKIINIIS